MAAAAPAGGIDAAHDWHEEHRVLEEQLAAHLDRLVALDAHGALATLHTFADALRAHLAAEETELLPRLAEVAAPRWGAAVYLAEHDRLRLLLSRQQARLAAAAEAWPRDERARRTMALALLDAMHSLRHVLEHHQQRERDALLQELATLSPRR